MIDIISTEEKITVETMYFAAQSMYIFCRLGNKLLLQMYWFTIPFSLAYPFEEHYINNRVELCLMTLSGLLTHGIRVSLDKK